MHLLNTASGTHGQYIRRTVQNLNIWTVDWTLDSIMNWIVEVKL